LTGNIKRNILDLNRKQARQSDFRQNLLQLVQQCKQQKQKQPMILDVHSFGSTPKGRVSKAFGDKYELVLLYCKEAFIDQKLYYYLVANQIKVGVGISTVGDIRVQMNELGITSVVTLEFYSRMPLSRLDFICLTLANYFSALK
jgi:hypothetical protein